MYIRQRDVLPMFFLASLSLACMPPPFSRELTGDLNTGDYLYLARLQYFTDTDNNGHHAIQYNVPNDGLLTRWGYVSNLNTANAHNIKMMCHDVGYNCSANLTACSATSVTVSDLAPSDYSIQSPECDASDFQNNFKNMLYCNKTVVNETMVFPATTLYVLECGETCNDIYEHESSCGPVLHHYNNGTACTFDDGLFRECSGDFAGTAACESCQYPAVTSNNPVLCADDSTDLCCNGEALPPTLTSTATTTPITEPPPQPYCSGSVHFSFGRYVADCPASGFTFMPQPNVRATNIPFNVADLWVPNNDITALRSNDFVAYTHLESLHLQHNKISIIEPGTFDPLWDLVEHWPLSSDEGGFWDFHMHGNPSQCTLVNNETYKVECTCAGHNGTYQQCPPPTLAPPTTQAPPTTPASKKKKIGLIVGLSVGGLFGVAVIVYVLKVQQLAWFKPAYEKGSYALFY